MTSNNPPMKIGITGGTGFLGAMLAARLRARGHRLVITTRDPARARSVSGDGVEVVAWNPLTEPLPTAALDGMDALIHLLGESVAGAWTPVKKERIAQSRLVGTRNLVDGLRRAFARPRILLSGSAVGFYGNRGNEELTEDAPAGTGFLADVCRRWEETAHDAEALGLRVVYLRTSLPLHPSGGFLQAVLPPFRVGLGARLGNGRQWLPWMHMEDWLELVLFALETESVRGPLNLSAPEPVRNADFTQSLATVLHRPALFAAPAFALRLAPGGMGDEMLLASQRVIPARALAAGYSFRFPQLDAALRDLLTS